MGNTAHHQAATGRSTINDVARVAGVSKKTVSHVLNGIGKVSAATRQKVEAAVAQLGFTPSPQARALALGHSDLLFLVHDGSLGEDLAELQRGVAEALADSRLMLVVHALPADGENHAAGLVAALERHRPAGTILPPPLSAMPDLVRAVRQAGVRLVCLGASPHEAPAMAVWSNQRMAAADAAGYLLALGHRRVAFVAGPEDSPLAREREQGYAEAMAGSGSAELIAGGDFGFASGLEAGRLLLELSPRPTAILAAHDEMAAGVLMAAALAGLEVPDDLSVMGIGGAEAGARLAPPLSTMRVPLAEMGHHAARILLGPDVPLAPSPGIPCALVPRGSTGPAPE